MELPEQVTVLHQKHPDYRLVAVNGVWGGVSSRGDIRVELFHEAQILPNKVVHELTPDQKLGREIKREGPDGTERTIFFEIVLTV